MDRDDDSSGTEGWGDANWERARRIWRGSNDVDVSSAGISRELHELEDAEETDQTDLIQDLYVSQLKAYKPAPQVSYSLSVIVAAESIGMSIGCSEARITLERWSRSTTMIRR